MQDQYLQAMGITRWRLRSPAVQAIEIQQPNMQQEYESTSDMQLAEVTERDVSCLDLTQLASAVAECTACELHRNRVQTVFGDGNKEARWLIVGEAPGIEEQQQGKPFVGETGKLLSAMLMAMGLKREQVFITNALKCHVPEGHSIHIDEIGACELYLQRQIALIQPTIIIAAGKVAAQSLLNVDDSIKQMRDKYFEYAETKIPVVVTYHPAYLLRKPSEKRKSWQDLQRAMSIFSQQVEVKR